MHRTLELDLKLEWETDWEQARQRAQHEHKPILLLELFGRLDEKWC